ncbi:MAG: hypothetical protein ACC726_14410, partial [Chloroflexota bacterium]
AGLTSVAREDGQLVLRFGHDWSRADAMRALAPTSMEDPLRALGGRIRYASNQVRMRVPGDPGEAWQLTRLVVARLSKSGRSVSV